MLPWRRVVWVVLAVGWGLLLIAAATLVLPAVGDQSAVDDSGPRSGGPPVLINEVAWSGTWASPMDQWIELYNPTDLPVDLAEWTLVVQSAGSIVALTGVIGPRGFYLIEVGHDGVISDIPADLIIVASIAEHGDTLWLQNPAGELVDSANGDGGEWPAGIVAPEPASMERIDPNAPDQDVNWASNDGVIQNGLDQMRHDIHGTPKAWNSAGVTADLALKKQGPLAARPGQDVTYTLAFSNTGGLTATQVLITDIVPAETRYLRSTAPYPLAEPVPGTLVWQVGSVAARSGPITFSLAVQLASLWTGTVTNSAVISSATGERDLQNNIASWLIRVDDSVSSAALVLTKQGPLTAAPGQDVTYTLAFSNAGGLTATQALITDILPAEAQYLRSTAPYTLAEPAPGTLVWQVGTVAAGSGPITFSLAVRLAPLSTGTVTNSAIISSATSELDPQDNRTSWPIQIDGSLPSADLALKKQGPLTAAPGQDVTYTLAFSNAGGLAATQVLITDLLPVEAQYLRSTAPYTLAESAPGTLVWRVGTVAAGSGPVTFSLAVRLAPLSTGTVTNSAVISSDAVEQHWQDNTASWLIVIDGPVPSADLRIEKYGPVQVEAGQLITYAIELANLGEISATGVVVTDRLPAGVSFISENSPFAFSRPAPDILRWELDAPLPSGPPVCWTVMGWVTDIVSELLTNSVVVSSSTPEANPADNEARVTTIAVLPPTVRLTAVHYRALTGGDEAVQIANLTAAQAQIGAWTLSDGVTVATFPPDVTLDGRQSIWIAEQATAFRAQFGFSPDFERVETDPNVPNLAGGWPGFANDGDEVILRDANGVIQDVLVYKAGNNLHQGWSGPALWPYERGGFAEVGQILYRQLDELTGRPVPDTNTAADWAQALDDPAGGRRVRYPGWDLEPWFRPLQVTETARLTVVVGPDTTYSATIDLVTRANRVLSIAGTRFESAGLAQAVAARAAAGVAVTLLLEGNPDGGVSDQERWACRQIESAGGRCLLMVDDPARGIWDRYAEQAAQYILIDGRWALIGSTSMTAASMPDDDKTDGTAGSRNILLITDAPAVVSRLTELFALDADPINHRDIATSVYLGSPPLGYRPPPTPDWTTYTVEYTAPLVVQGEIGFEILQAPESILRQRDGLLGLLARTGPGDTVLVEGAVEPLHWGDPDSDPTQDPNLRLEAYLAAAARGARVRLLLDESPDDPVRAAQNEATCHYVRQRAQELALPIRCALANPTGLGIGNHMVLVKIGGRGYVHVGSINGLERANKESRGVALHVQSGSVYAYLARVYERDWPHPIYLPLVLARYPGSADHLLISEVLYDPIGLDTGREWIELTNPRPETIELAGWMLGDAVAADDREGLYLFPSGASVSAYQTLVIAMDGARFAASYGFEPDFELVNSLPGVPDLFPHPTWGRVDLLLSNTGDEVLLLDSFAQPVDVLVWGDGAYPGVVPHPGGTGEGHSLERYPRWRDSDDCQADFRVQAIPSPGAVP